MTKKDEKQEALTGTQEPMTVGQAVEGEEQTTSAISRRFLLGDLTKAVMREIQDMQIPWGAMPEKDQQKVINRVSDHCRAIVREVVDIIVADGKVSEQCEIESVLFKDGCKLVLKMSSHAENRHAIADAAGARALLVIPNAAKYFEGDMPKAQSDQPDLLGDATGGGIPGAAPPPETPPAGTKGPGDPA